MRNLSQYLLNLSKGAFEKPSLEFQDWALSETKKLIPFDSGLWGKGNWIGDTPVVHHVHLHKLAENFIQSWLRFQHEDKLIRDVQLNSDITFNVDVAREYANTDIYEHHCKAFQMEHILQTASVEADTRIFNTVVLYRADINQPFSEEERNLKEIIFPHLIESARINWLSNLPQMFSAYQRSNFNAFATCSSEGMLLMALPSFMELCSKEWTNWKGPYLPAEIGPKLQEGQNYIGKKIAIRIIRENDVMLLCARLKVLADTLSPQEMKIARQIAEGENYKAIALELGISPATVKTHTAHIFEKLGIHDKAKLSFELSKTEI